MLLDPGTSVQPEAVELQTIRRLANRGLQTLLWLQVPLCVFVALWRGVDAIFRRPIDRGHGSRGNAHLGRVRVGRGDAADGFCCADGFDCGAAGRKRRRILARSTSTCISSRALPC